MHCEALLRFDKEEQESEILVKIQEGACFSSYNLRIPGFP